jgi:prepilin-type processing-associated H-X9-DG protein
MRAALLGLGTASPPHAIAQRDAAELAKAYCCQSDNQAAVLPTLFQRTRVDTRSSVLLDGSTVGPRQSFFQPALDAMDGGPTTGQRMARYAQDAAPLAIAAARQAISAARLDASVITHVVTVSCTGFISPGLDIALIRHFGLRADISRTHVGFMGCHGALNALAVARAFIEASPLARVLLCSVELCSLHFGYGWHPDRLVANALFADGAAAALLGPSGESPRHSWQLETTGSCLFPDSLDAMGWRIGDHGFEMRLSSQVPALIGAHLPAWMDAWLARAGLTLADVRSWAIHPGGPRIVDAVRTALRLPAEAAAGSHEVLAAHGNMSSPTGLFILERLRARHAERPCVALAFGPGLVAEAALFI